MKRYISAILIPCLLMQIFGCYSFQPLESDEDLNNYLHPAIRQIIFIKNNGQKIKANVYDCELLDNHKYIIYGYGTSLNKNTLKSQYFEGELNEGSIDSVKTISIDSKDYLICWLKDSTRISFNYNNYSIFNLDPDSSYWLIKTYNPPKCISVNDISGIEVEKLNIAATIPMIILGIAFMVGLYALGKNLPHGPVLPESF